MTPMPMDMAKAVVIFYIEISHFIALVIALATNYYFYHRGERGPLLKRYLALQGALILWIVSKMGKTLAPNADLRWFFIVTQYLGVCFLGSLFLFFAWQFTFRKAPPRTVRYPLNTLSSLFFLSMATNPLHFLFYDRYDFYGDSFGPIFYFQMGYTYLLVLISMIFSFSAVVKWRHSPWEILVGLSAFVPLIVNILYITDIINPYFDITPLTMITSLLFFGAAAFRSHFLGLLPVAQNALMYNLKDPLIVTKKGKTVKTHIFERGTPPLGRIKQGGKIYLKIRERENRGKTLYHYIDVTLIEQLKRALRDKNHQLEESIDLIESQNREKKQLIEDQLINYTHRELHDILGHSLTQVLLLLRAAMVEGVDAQDRAQKIDTCRKIIDKSLSELNVSLDGKIENREILSIALQKVIEEFAQTDRELEFIVRGTEKILHPKKVFHLVRCCQEGLTNAVKHGGEGIIYLTVNFGQKKVTVILADTGGGTDDFTPGSGLTMMNRRIGEMGGTLRVSTERGEGFQLTISVPFEY